MLLATAPHMFALTKSRAGHNRQGIRRLGEVKTGTIMYGSTGPGSHQRLAMENFRAPDRDRTRARALQRRPRSDDAVLTG